MNNLEANLRILQSQEAQAYWEQQPNPEQAGEYIVAIQNQIDELIDQLLPDTSIN